MKSADQERNKMVTIKTTEQIKKIGLFYINDIEVNQKQKWALVEEQEKEYQKLTKKLEEYLEKWDKKVIPLLISRGIHESNIIPSFPMIMQEYKKILFG